MGVPQGDQDFRGEEAEGDLIEALLVVMAQCWVGTELVLTRAQQKAPGCLCGLRG